MGKIREKRLKGSTREGGDENGNDVLTSLMRVGCFVGGFTFMFYCAKKKKKGKEIKNLLATSNFFRGV